MDRTPAVSEDSRSSGAPHTEREANSSGVSWGAVVGGAFVIAAFSLILLALGAGLGLSSVSPWSTAGVTATTFGTATIIWFIFVELIASGLGGYLTGRSRTKWVVIHTDEVYFRDTANGFLAWAVALVITVTFLASAAASMVGAAEGQAAGVLANHNSYFVDSLFRSPHPVDQRGFQEEAGRTFAHALIQDDSLAADKSALASLVAAETGLSMPEAEQRVSDALTAAHQAADTARKTTARMLLWLFVALMTGAFSASYAATIGGRQRDHVKLV